MLTTVYMWYEGPLFIYVWYEGPPLITDCTIMCDTGGQPCSCIVYVWYVIQGTSPVHASYMCDMWYRGPALFTHRICVIQGPSPEGPAPFTHHISVIQGTSAWLPQPRGPTCVTSACSVGSTSAAASSCVGDDPKYTHKCLYRQIHPIKLFIIS